MPIQRSKIRKWEPPRLPENAELRDVVKAYNKLVYQYVNTLSELTTKFAQMEEFGRNQDGSTPGYGLYGYRSAITLAAGATDTITHNLGYIPNSFVILYQEPGATGVISGNRNSWDSTTATFTNVGAATGFWVVWVY